jgi:hypothetical protein
LVDSVQPCHGGCTGTGENSIQADTYDKLCLALLRKALDEALQILRRVVVDLSIHTSTQVQAQVAVASIAHQKAPRRKVLTVLAYAKAAGYQLDNIRRLKTAGPFSPVV